MRRFPSSLLQFNLHDQAPSLVALGMLGGAVWYFSIPFEPDRTTLLLGLVGAALALAWVRFRSGSKGVLALALIGFAVMIGANAGRMATDRLIHTSVDRALGPVLVEGWIVKAEPATRGVRLVIQTHAIYGLPASDQPRTIRLTHISALQTEPGRYVRCWAVLRPPPAPVIEGDYDFDRQAWYGGLGAVGYVQGRCRGGALGAPRKLSADLALQLGRARRLVARHVETASGERAGGFAAALASGDRSLMRASDQEALRGSGLAHLLAISGLHMGIVGGIVFLFVWRGLALIEPIALRTSVKKPAAAVALVACGVYLIISGASVSTQRAYVMALVFFGAVLFDRTALTQRSLAIAMILIILIAPWSVLTPGFQMSFAATAALIAAYEAWRRRRHAQGRGQGHRVMFWLKSLAVTSLVSSLATMPFALFHFNRVAGLGLIANLLAMPIISLISAPLAALALILSPFGWDGPALRLFGWSLEWVLAIAHTLSVEPSASGVTWPRMPASSLVVFSTGLVILCLSPSWRLGLSAGLISTLLGIAVWSLSARDRVHWAPSGAVFLEAASGKVTKIDWLKGPGLDPLQFSAIAATEICAPEARCAFAMNQRTIVLAGDDVLGDCARLPGDQTILIASTTETCAGADSALMVHWQEVIRQNGITLDAHKDGFRRNDKLACGKRPWRPCLEQAPD